VDRVCRQLRQRREVLIQARGGDVRVYGRTQKARDKKSDKSAEVSSEAARNRDVNGAPSAARPERKIPSPIVAKYYALARKCAAKLVPSPSSNSRAVVPAAEPQPQLPLAP